MVNPVADKINKITGVIKTAQFKRLKASHLKPDNLYIIGSLVFLGLAVSGFVYSRLQANIQAHYLDQYSDQIYRNVVTVDDNWYNRDSGNGTCLDQYFFVQFICPPLTVIINEFCRQSVMTYCQKRDELETNKPRLPSDGPITWSLLCGVLSLIASIGLFVAWLPKREKLKISSEISSKREEKLTFFSGKSERNKGTPLKEEKELIPFLSDAFSLNV